MLPPISAVFLLIISAFGNPIWQYTLVHGKMVDMFVRFLASLILALLPLGALADDLGPSTSVNSALGQQGGTAGSNADGATLQPAGLDPLQSTTQDSSGLTAPNSSSLQAPASSDAQLKVILGNEADGIAHQITDDSLAQTERDAFVIGVLLLGLVVAILLLRSRRPQS